MVTTNGSSINDAEADALWTQFVSSPAPMTEAQ